MFPFHQLGSGGELSFQAAGDPEEEEEEQVADPLNHEQQQQDLILDEELLAAVNLYTAAGASSESTTISFSSMRAPAEPIPAADRGRGRARGPGRGRRPEDDRRKMQHRDIERQRRQDMSSLFSDLRSLLPLDYLKGKRSMSDHIAESANYIKHLQGRIKVLGDTREQLRGTLAGASHGRDHEEAQTHHSTSASTMITNNVEVFTSSGSLQVQICCAQGGDPPLLSTSLRVLLEAGLDVVSCVTNKVNGGGLLHNIHCQLTDVGWGEFDVQQLQQRLYQLVCSNS